MRVEDNWGTFVSLSKWNVSWSSDTGVLDNTCLCLQLCPAVPWELSPSRVLIWCSQALDTAAPGLRQSRHPLTKGSGRIVPDGTAARCVWDLYLQLHGGKSLRPSPSRAVLPQDWKWARATAAPQQTQQCWWPGLAGGSCSLVKFHWKMLSTI